MHPVRPQRTLTLVAVDYDPRKNRINIARRGISFREAERLFEGWTINEIDDREDYGETRLVARGLIRGRVYVCVYTWRGETRWIISLRPATRSESHEYYREYGRYTR